MKWNYVSNCNSIERRPLHDAAIFQDFDSVCSVCSHGETFVNTWTFHLDDKISRIISPKQTAASHGPPNRRQRHSPWFILKSFQIAIVRDEVFNFVQTNGFWAEWKIIPEDCQRVIAQRKEIILHIAHLDPLQQRPGPSLVTVKLQRIRSCNDNHDCSGMTLLQIIQSLL